MIAGASIRVSRVNAVSMDAKLLTLNRLSERTGLPTAWLRREADAGHLPCIRAGRLRMFDLAAVLKALAERQKNGVSRGQ
jgi:hypothetical protein